jgi:phage terminase large subunit
LKLSKRIRGVAGGTSASKTISILLVLIDYAQSVQNELISIVSETMPHIKRGAERDFKNILQQHQYWNEDRWNATDHIYTFETGSKIEFFSADQSSKLHGPRRDVLFINEANNVSWEAYTQLEIRTKKTIWLDWNPTHEFWFYTELQGKPNVDFIRLTYKDNEALDSQIVQSIESRRSNKNWWLVYGLGELGETQGKIYSDWQFIDEIPHEARLERYGLDFGYSNDPACIVAIYKYNSGFIIDEVTYQVGLKNRQLADILKNIPQALVVADSAEPKSIDEIKEYGITILPSTKGPGSVNRGINYVQDQRISVTKRSLNIIKEYRNYLWKTDRDGNITTVPDSGFDHSMDAIRYGLESASPQQQESMYIPKMRGLGGIEIGGYEI